MTKEHFIFAAGIAGSYCHKATRDKVAGAFEELFEKFNYNFSEKKFKEEVERVWYSSDEDGLDEARETLDEGRKQNE